MKMIVGSPRHDQRFLSTKTVAVDVEIYDLLRWMNSFSEVYTIASCQGDDVESDGRPYVLWFSLDSFETKMIMKKFNHNARTTMRYDDSRGLMVYRTSWLSLESLRSKLPFYLS